MIRRREPTHVLPSQKIDARSRSPSPRCSRFHEVSAQRHPSHRTLAAIGRAAGESSACAIVIASSAFRSIATFHDSRRAPSSFPPPEESLVGAAGNAVRFRPARLAPRSWRNTHLRAICEGVDVGPLGSSMSARQASPRCPPRDAFARYDARFAGHCWSTEVACGPGRPWWPIAISVDSALGSPRACSIYRFCGSKRHSRIASRAARAALRLPAAWRAAVGDLRHYWKAQSSRSRSSSGPSCRIPSTMPKTKRRCSMDSAVGGQRPTSPRCEELFRRSKSSIRRACPSAGLRSFGPFALFLRAPCTGVRTRSPSATPGIFA